MNQDRLPHSRRNHHLSHKRLLLHLGLRILHVIVIEPNLTHRNAARSRSEFAQPSQSFRIGLRRLLRMNARARKDNRQLRSDRGLCNFECMVHLGRAFTNADRQNSADASGLRARQHTRQLVGVVHVQVSVRINKVHRFRLANEPRQRNLSSREAGDVPPRPASPCRTASFSSGPDATRERLQIHAQSMVLSGCAHSDYSVAPVASTRPHRAERRGPQFRAGHR